MWIKLRARPKNWRRKKKTEAWKKYKKSKKQRKKEEKGPNNQPKEQELVPIIIVGNVKSKT